MTACRPRSPTSATSSKVTAFCSPSTAATARASRRIAKWLLDNDRGEFVRDRDGYDQVLRRAFGKVNLAIRDDYSRVPYTFIIGVSQK